MKVSQFMALSWHYPANHEYLNEIGSLALIFFLTSGAHKVISCRAETAERENYYILFVF